MSDTTYNGWRNYETWAVNLWMENDAGGSEYWREAAQDAYDDATVTPSVNARLTGSEPFDAKERAALTLADRIKEEIEEGSPLTEGSLYTDLLNAALGEVDWYEIATNLLSDVDEEAAIVE